MSNDEKDPGSGYSYDKGADSVYHFRHLTESEAEEASRDEGLGFIVETIAWVAGQGQKNEYHLSDLSTALLFATEIQDKRTGETVTAIRQASKDEAWLFKKAARRKRELQERGLSDQEVEATREA